MFSVIELHIVTGFLGAGKTTFLNKLLREGAAGPDTVLVENEFGDVSIDGDVIGSGIRMLELASGCICCSLQGSFVDGILEVVDAFHPRMILIEPTGVGNLADILAACGRVCARIEAEIRSVVSVVSAESLPALLMTGGDFFRRQVADARYILMSCTQNLTAEELSECRELLEEVNDRAPVRWEPWEELRAADILAEAETAWTPLREEGEAAPPPNYESMAFFPRRSYTPESAEELLRALAGGSLGTVWRAKGFLRTADGYLRAELAPGGGSEAVPAGYDGPAKFVVIGEKLDRRQLRAIFR